MTDPPAGRVRHMFVDDIGYARFGRPCHYYIYQNLHTGCLADALRGVGLWCEPSLDGVPARGGSGIVPSIGPKGGPPANGGPPSPIPGTPSSTRRINWRGVRGELPVLLEIDRGGVPPGVLRRILGASGL